MALKSDIRSVRAAAKIPYSLVILIWSGVGWFGLRASGYV